MFAARNNNLNVIELLLKSGADKNAKTKLGKNAYDFARMNKHHEAENLLK
jgi:ankyrin repeat protein